MDSSDEKDDNNEKLKTEKSALLFGDENQLTEFLTERHETANGIRA